MSTACEPPAGATEWHSTVLWSEQNVRSVFERCALTQPDLSGGPAAELDMLRAVASRPEFGPFHEFLRIRIDPACSGLWALDACGVIHISPATLTSVPEAAFHLRFAAEFAMLGSLLPDAMAGPERGFLRALLSLHTALSYYQQMTRRDRAVIRIRAAGGIAAALAAAERFDMLARDGSARCAALAELIDAIPIAGETGEKVRAAGTQARMAARAAAISLLIAAHPAERLLTTGGDDRLLVSEQTGLNGYGCSPRPRPWAITFSSSTASSISAQAYGEVEKMRRDLLRAGLSGCLETFLSELGLRTRRGIATLLGFGPDIAEIALTASGTDAELIGLWLAMGRARQRPVVNVIIGPDEVGSGSVPAAAGRHFNPQSPLGGAVEPGEMVPGFPAGRIRVEGIPIRDQHGQRVPPRSIHESLCKLVGDAAKGDETVLLHLVDCSKTGLMAPDLESVHELLERHPQHVVVVVDAAQMRVSRAMLRRYLDAGFIVLITGSKFFTGPPFSGAVVIPRKVLDTLPGLVDLPAGIAAYATSADFPEALDGHTGQLPRACNVGLLARWQAALWEMAAFYSVPPDLRSQTIAAFGEAVRDAIARLPELELCSAPARKRTPAGHWDALPTIFTFLIYRTVSPGQRAEPLRYEDGRLVYQWLNSDVSSILPASAPADDVRLAAQCCHIPQPVKLAHNADGWTAGMRIAAGARLVSGVHLDPALGATREARLHSELRDMEIVLRKAAMIARRWSDFASSQPHPPDAGQEL